MTEETLIWNKKENILAERKWNEIEEKHPCKGKKKR